MRGAGFLFGAAGFLVFALSPAAGSAKVESAAKSVAGGAVLPDSATRRQLYRELIKREAVKHHLPFDIADAVATIESGYDPHVVGSVGEMGLMQVRPATAAMLGFSGTPTDLAKPEINVRYGVAYLAEAWRLAHGDVCRALMKYRAGHGEEVMTPLSVTYCSRARAHLASINSPLAAGMPAMISADAEAGSPEVPRAPTIARAKRGTPAASQTFWAAQEARVRAISARLESKWHRRMAAIR